MDGISKIYWINLKSNETRRLQMESQFEKLGISAIRFEAINGLKDDLQIYNNWLTEKEIKKAFTMKRDFHQENSPGSLGCFLSHALIWKEIDNDPDLDIVLVFEDDVILDETFPLNIKTVLEKTKSLLPYNWGYLNIGYSPIVPGSKKKTIGEIFYTSLSLCTGAYLIRKHMASFFLKQLDKTKIKKQVDWWIADFGKTDQIFWMSNPIIELDKFLAFRSDIKHPPVKYQNYIPGSSTNSTKVVTSAIIVSIVFVSVILLVVLIIVIKLKYKKK